eukprot:6231488-Amphidinium_carterae.1
MDRMFHGGSVPGSSQAEIYPGVRRDALTGYEPNAHSTEADDPMEEAALIMAQFQRITNVSAPVIQPVVQPVV